MKKNLNFSLSFIFILMSLAIFFAAGWATGSRVNSPEEVVMVNSTPIPLQDPALLYSFDVVEFNNGVDFKEEIGNYIEHEKYSCALELLMLASSDQIMDNTAGDLWYCAIDCDVNISPGDSVSLPGAGEEYNPSRDWLIPDSGYGSASRLWDRYARVFAKRFNLRAKQRYVENKTKVPGTENETDREKNESKHPVGSKNSDEVSER